MKLRTKKYTKKEVTELLEKTLNVFSEKKEGRYLSYLTITTSPKDTFEVPVYSDVLEKIKKIIIKKEKLKGKNK